ncbi:MAG: M1 family metallopeptidase [Roseicyclus sp.]
MAISSHSRAPARGTPRTPIAALILALAVALLPSGLRAEPPVLRLDIEIDPASRAFTASALLRAPEGEVTLPAADWLAVDALRLGGRAAPVPRGGALGAEDHRGRDLGLDVSGTLPAPDGEMDAAAAAPEATRLVGPLWFPTDGAAIREIDIRAALPEGQRIAATGTLVSESVSATGTEARFAFTGFPGDFGLFAGPYTVTEEIRDGLRLRTYFDRDDPDLAQRYRDAVAAYIARYEAEVGAYPHGGFSVVSTPLPVGLGFAGLTYISRDILGHPYMTGRSLAHEVLHSWWGNAVGIDFASGNWAEGLTTFQADYALAEDEGPEAARAMRIGWIRELAGLPEEAARPLTAFRSAGEARDQSEGYGKAAFVFHMLRDELGEETFAEGIRRFYAANRNGVAGWQDLRAAFEAVSGRDLGWFFGQWTGRTGLPRVTPGPARVTGTAGGGHDLTLSLRQDAPHYRLRLPLRIETAAGPVDRVVRIEGAETTVTLRLEARPRSVALDPDFHVARMPRAGELPPILREAGTAGTFVAVAASPGAAQTTIAEALAPLIRGAELDWRDAELAADDRPVLIAGHPDDVAARRPGHLGPLPQGRAAGATQLWVERDGSGRLWLFLAFEDAGDLAADLRGAPFHGGQSHLGAREGRITASGVWPGSPGDTALDLTGAEGTLVAP